MKALICGDRNWTDYEMIRDVVASLPHTATVIHGACRGADLLAKQAAKEFADMTVVDVPAEWRRYGNAAGPIRNKEMLGLQPDVVIAFHDNLDASKGTKNMVTQARKAGIRVEVYGHGKEVEVLG